MTYGTVDCATCAHNAAMDSGGVGTDGKTWAEMFNFLEASSILDADYDCTYLPAANFSSDNTVTASYLEVSISTALVVQLSWVCTLGKFSLMMGNDCQTSNLYGMETVY